MKEQKKLRLFLFGSFCCCSKIHVDFDLVNMYIHIHGIEPLHGIWTMDYTYTTYTLLSIHTYIQTRSYNIYTQTMVLVPSLSVCLSCRVFFHFCFLFFPSNYCDKHWTQSFSIIAEIKNHLRACFKLFLHPFHSAWIFILAFCISH